MNYNIIPGLNSSNRIIDIVANYYNLTRDEMLEKSRNLYLVQARQITMYFLKKYTKLSSKKIATELYLANHTTVLYGIKTIKNRIDTEKEVLNDVKKIDLIINPKPINRPEELILKYISPEDFDIIKQMCYKGDWPRKNPTEYALFIAQFLEKKAEKENS